MRTLTFFAPAPFLLITLFFPLAYALADSAEIRIRDGGFFPAKITVDKGTTVVWINESEGEHWPASDLHPTHTDYPAKASEDCGGSSFDACRGLTLGESWSFTFDRIGTWGFHDHLNPRLTGVVEIVESEEAKASIKSGFFSTTWAELVSLFRKFGAFLQGFLRNPGDEFGISGIQKGESIESYIRTQMTHCEDTGAKSRCYEAIAKLIIRAYSLEEVMQVLRTAEQYPEVHGQCHKLTHFLAREEYKKNKSIPESYAMCNEACWAGCYHGVMEQHFSEQGFSVNYIDDEKLSQEVARVCATKEQYEIPVEYYECLHGLGHAMMFITNGDLPKSLRYCDFLGDRERSEACYGGVFMENSSSSTNRDHPSEYLDADNPLYPCDILEDKYLPVCYQYQSSYFAFLSDFDWEKTAGMCTMVPDPYQRQCFNMFGSNQVGLTQEYEIMRANCALVPEEYHTECVLGAVGSIGMRFKSEPERMLDFCSGVAFSPAKTDCYTRVGHVEFTLREDAKTVESVCAAIQEEVYENACLEALRPPSTDILR